MLFDRYWQFANIETASKFKESKPMMIDASGNNMNISGTVNVNIFTKYSKTISQNMKMLDTKTYCNIILGRDFLSNFTTVEFDFSQHCIKLGPDWHDCVTIGNHTSVKVIHPAILQPRSETIVNV